MEPAQGTKQYEKEHEEEQEPLLVHEKSSRLAHEEKGQSPSEKEEDGASRGKVKWLGEKFALSTTNNGSTDHSSSFTKRRQEPLHMGGFSGTLSGDDLDLCAQCRFHVVHVSSIWEHDQFY